MYIDVGNWVDTPTHLVRLALALPVARTREREERSDGLRTFTIVTVASCGYVIATQALLTNSPDGLSRIILGLITGIGFIGSGATLKSERQVKGTATAASIWATVLSVPLWSCAGMTSPRPSALSRLSFCDGSSPRNSRRTTVNLRTAGWCAFSATALIGQLVMSPNLTVLKPPDLYRCFSRHPTTNELQPEKIRWYWHPPSGEAQL